MSMREGLYLEIKWARISDTWWKKGYSKLRVCFKFSCRGNWSSFKLIISSKISQYGIFGSEKRLWKNLWKKIIWFWKSKWLLKQYLLNIIDFINIVFHTHSTLGPLFIEIRPYDYYQSSHFQLPFESWGPVWLRIWQIQTAPMLRRKDFCFHVWPELKNRRRHSMYLC